ncbi:TetR family transcriptional regulator [Streptomyces sp. NPDC093109]|uniref:TetR/AcrR family transcriptional regulator n=1 Tax=Streptomyces sp. NPDC093109 TaxID=3154977 RepID=UPI00344F88DC
MEQGVRERGKARRRQAILRSAYKLFADRGFEPTTIADIAAEAEVSPRTVTLYFPSKLELATSYLDENVERLEKALRESGGTGSDALENWLRAEIADTRTQGDLEALWDRMMERNPQLRAIANNRLTSAIQEGARIFAAGRGEAPDGFVPRMVAGAAAAVISEVFLHPSEENIATAMNFLGAGIAAVTAGPEGEGPDAPRPAE